MITLHVPPHPTHDFACGKCDHYLKSQAKKRVMSPAGIGPEVSELIAAGKAKELETATVATIAPCTRFPTWAVVAENHWCGEYASRVKS